MIVPRGFGRAAEPSPARSSARPRAAERVIALVDDRDCTAAAIRVAVRLATARRTPLEVAAAPRGPSALLSIAAIESRVGGALPLLAGNVESGLFSAVAAAVAPSGLAWDFTVLDRSADLVALTGGERPVVLVVAPHRGRSVGSRLAGMARRAHRACPAAVRLRVFDCAHRDPRTSA